LSEYKGSSNIKTALAKIVEMKDYVGATGDLHAAVELRKSFFSC